MNGYTEDLETILEAYDTEDYGEAGFRRGPVRTPSRQSSFAPRPTGVAASQSQVQSAARNLDSKIETLSNAVKALDTRVNGIAADQQRIGTALKKEVEERKKTGDGVRADLQQTKVLGALLPMISTKTVELNELNASGEPTGNKQKVLAPPDNAFASFLPFLIAMSPSGDGAKAGPFGDPTMLLLFAILMDRK